MKENAAASRNRSGMQQRACNTESMRLGQAVHQGDHRVSQQDQGSGEVHQNKMLHHMSGEGFMVEMCERSRQDGPGREDSAHEGRKTPTSNHIREIDPVAIPASRINEHKDEKNKSNRSWY